MENLVNFRKELHKIADDNGFASVPEVLKKIEDSGYKYNKSKLAELRNHATETLNQLATSNYLTGLGCFIDNFGLNAENATSHHPNYLTPPPPTPEFCIGRDKMLETMHQKLMTGKNLLLVNGLGGMGKTTLALQYLAIPKYYSAYQHIAWVSLINQELTDALINSLHMGMEIDLKKYPDKEEQLQAIAQTLANQPGNNLLIIDNANDAKELAENEKLLKQLHCKIVITSRGNPDNYTKIDVDELDMDDAKQVFLHHYRLGDLPNLKDLEDLNTDLENLLTHINRHTLLTELLAKAGKKKGLSPNELLKLLKETDTQNPYLNRTITVGLHADMTNKQKETTLHNYIQSLFEPENETEANKDFLQKFCLFANMDVSLLHIKKMWKVEAQNENDFEDFLDNLVKSGWLSYKNQNYRMHQLLAGVIANKLKPNAQDCTVLINSLEQILVNEHLSRVAIHYLPYAQVFANHLNEDDFSLALFCIRLCDVYMEIGQHIPALEAIEKAEKIYKAIDEKQKLAVCYERKGSIYKLIGELDLALENYKKDIALSKELYSANPQNESLKHSLAISYSKLGAVYSSLGKLDLAIEIYEKEIILFKEPYSTNLQNESLKHGLAISYEKIGDVYFSLGNLDLALENYEKNIELSTAHYMQNPKNERLKNGLAISCEKLGEVHLRMKEPAKSFIQYSKFNLLLDQLYAENPKNVAIASNYAESQAIIAAFNIKANDFGAAQPKIDLAKKIWTELLALSKIAKYEWKLSLLDKMLEKDADLDRLIIEMSSF